jgi:hypothetical protein
VKSLTRKIPRYNHGIELANYRTEPSGVARTIIGGGDIHIFVFTYHKTNGFEKELITQKMNI